MNLLRTSTGRRVLFTALYASEGAPIGYIWWALPTKLAAAGLETPVIALFTAPLVLPWSLKFLWAPLVDALQSPRWGLRAWIIAAQIAMGLTLLPAFWLSLAEHYRLLAFIFLGHAVMAATQDVAVDALCIRTTPRSEQGAINGWMQVGYLTSRALFGGAILYVEDHVLVQRLGLDPKLAGNLVLGALIACIWLSMLLLILCCRPEPAPARPGADALRSFLSSLRAAFTRRSTLLGLGFALVGGAAFEAVGAVARPMLVEFGQSAAAVGRFTIITVVAMGLGALAGGLAADRIGRVRLVSIITVLIAANVGVIAVVLIRPPEAPSTLSRLLIALYVLIGAFTASSYGLFMNLTDRNLGATQFSTFMAATNLCESWATYTVGKLIWYLGYPASFGAMAALSLLALPLLRWMSAVQNTSTGTLAAEASREPVD